MYEQQEHVGLGNAHSDLYNKVVNRARSVCPTRSQLGEAFTGMWSNVTGLAYNFVAFFAKNPKFS